MGCKKRSGASSDACVPSRHNLTFHCEDHSQLTALALVDLESIAETGLSPCSSLACPQLVMAQRGHWYLATFTNTRLKGKAVL